MSAISIRLDGVDITDDVVLTSATFSSTVNGIAAPCQFQIKDVEHVHNPIAGKEIAVDVDGVRKFTGIALKVSRIYHSAVVDTTNPETTARMFLVEGVNINYLFGKRVMYNSNVLKGFLVPPVGLRCADVPDDWIAGARSDETLEYLITNYSDLLDDGITLEIADFGSPNPDKCGNYGSAQTLLGLMLEVNRMLMGVYYITPDKVFRYHDADTVTTPYYLTDQPNPADPNAIAPRSYKALNDASKMVNDALVWGEAIGFKNTVFARATDDDDSEGESSITTHGRWQYGDFSQEIGRQVTAQKRADSFVYGVSTSQKGARWPRVVVEATVYEGVFELGDVVTCEFHSYTGIQREPFLAPEGNARSTGLATIDLPIRTMVLMFPTPTDAVYRLILSREIDDPYSANEYLFHDIDLGGGGLPPKLPPKIEIPEWDVANACVVLDSFSRVTNYTWDPDSEYHSTGGWGTGEHLDWSITNYSVYVNGEAGVMDLKEPEWQDHRAFGGGSVTATAMIPNGIPASDIVIKFSLGRLDRLWQQGGATTEASGWLDGTNRLAWENPGAMAEYNPMLPSGYGQQPFLNRAFIGANVIDGPVYTSAAVPGLGDVINKTILVGGYPSTGATTGSGGQWHSNAGGFIPGIYCWGSSSWVKYGYNPWFEWYSNGGLRYYGGQEVQEILHAGPDSAAWIFNQPVSVTIRIGAFATTISKGQGPFGQTSQGWSGQALGIQMTGPGGFTKNSSKVIEPGFDYYMRVWSPDGLSQYGKIWEGFGGQTEPEEWDFFNADKPPYAYNLTDGSVMRWPLGVPTSVPLTGQQIRIDGAYQPMHQYSLLVSNIYACPHFNGLIPPYAYPGTGPYAGMACTFGANLFSKAEEDIGGAATGYGWSAGEIHSDFTGSPANSSYSVTSTHDLALPRILRGTFSTDEFDLTNPSSFASARITVNASNGESAGAGIRMSGTPGFSTLFGAPSTGTWSGPVEIPDPTARVGRELWLDVDRDGNVTASAGGATITRTGPPLDNVHTSTYLIGKDGSGYTPHLKFIELALGACEPVEGTEVHEGQVTEDEVPFTDGTIYQLENIFVGGSTTVWLNGHQLRRGTAYDYVEHPQEGTIELLDPLDPDDVIKVDYTAVGAI